MNVDKLKDELLRDEGFVPHVYLDHLGYQTIGVGRLVDKRRGGGLSQDEAMYLLGNDIARVVTALDKQYPFFKSLSDTRQRALCNMAFQLGLAGLAKFKTMLGHIAAGRFELAASAAKNSLWARQTPNRADRVIAMIRNG